MESGKPSDRVGNVLLSLVITLLIIVGVAFAMFSPVPFRPVSTTVIMLRATGNPLERIKHAVQILEENGIRNPQGIGLVGADSVQVILAAGHPK